MNNYDARRFPLLQSFHENKGNPPAVAKVLAIAGTRSEESRLIPALARGLSGEATRLLADAVSSQPALDTGPGSWLVIAGWALGGYSALARIASRREH